MAGVSGANEQVVRRLFEALDRGDVALAAALVREDYLQHNPIVAPGREGFVAFFQDLRRAFPDLRLTIEDVIAAGDRVVVRLTGVGTHEGPFLGIPATGRRVRASSIDIFRLSDGMLAEHWDVLDLFGLLSQIGAIPPLGGGAPPQAG